MSESRRRLLPYAALITLALIWGGSFLAIKIVVRDMSPEVLLLLRSLTGFLALALIIGLSGRPLFGPGWRHRLGSFAFLAVTNSVVPWIAIAWGEEHISSGLASILNATTTLWTAVLIFWVVPSERPSALNYLGVLIGFGGSRRFCLCRSICHPMNACSHPKRSMPRAAPLAGRDAGASSC